MTFQAIYKVEITRDEWDRLEKGRSKDSRAARTLRDVITTRLLRAIGGRDNYFDHPGPIYFINPETNNIWGRSQPHRYGPVADQPSWGPFLKTWGEKMSSDELIKERERDVEGAESERKIESEQVSNTIKGMLDSLVGPMKVLIENSPDQTEYLMEMTSHKHGYRLYAKMLLQQRGPTSTPPIQVFNSRVEGPTNWKHTYMPSRGVGDIPASAGPYVDYSGGQDNWTLHTFARSIKLAPKEVRTVMCAVDRKLGVRSQFLVSVPRDFSEEQIKKTALECAKAFEVDDLDHWQIVDRSPLHFIGWKDTSDA